MQSRVVSETKLHVRGLTDSAEILIDVHGVPHIRARNQHDLYLVQGFNAARDRLWQIDLWRKRGLGLLARDFGPSYLAQDRATRLFQYRGSLDAEWAAYGDVDLRATLTAFVAGVNAWIELTDRDPNLLPPEFARFDTRPDLWEPEDVIRIRSHARAHNALSEEQRARVTAHGDVTLDQLRHRTTASHVVTVPEGVDYADLPTDLLDVFRLATAPVGFGNDAAADEHADEDQLHANAVSVPDGSNNWAVAGHRTASGRPIVASDPHRVHTLPSLRYVVHLTAPGLDVIGAGEPAVPGVSIGHNRDVGFGLTICPADQEDLYIYETHPDNANMYRYRDCWEEMTVVEEAVPVRGTAPVTVSLKFTRHGPVVHEDPEKRTACAVRTVWTTPGTSAYLGSLGYIAATTLTEFMAALPHWGAPAVNHVCADTDGNIGWAIAGKIPVRHTWDGLLPVPGDGTHEWDGFHRFADLPKSINPDTGFVASANEYNVPDDYPNEERRLFFESQESSRISRIREVLGADGHHTVEGSMALQVDEVSPIARRVLPMIDLSFYISDDLATAGKVFDGWDGALAAGSAAAALFQVWWSRHLKPRLIRELIDIPDIVFAVGAGDNESLVSVLESRCGVGSVGPAAEPWSALVHETLIDAVGSCRLLMGTDYEHWAWGSLHACTFRHPMSSLSTEWDGHVRDVGPFPVGGSESTVQFASFESDSFDVVNGATFRVVMDIGQWDEGRFVNAPGQSGDARSPHYDDHADQWAAGEYVPLLFTPAAIEQAARAVLVLLPQPELATQ